MRPVCGGDADRNCQSNHRHECDKRDHAEHSAEHRHDFNPAVCASWPGGGGSCDEYSDRDNRFDLDWEPISRDPAATEAWLDEWVYGLPGRAEYREKLGPERLARLRPTRPAMSGAVDYGVYE